MTYERLKAFCEANSISMSQLVETRVNDYLVERQAAGPMLPRPTASPVAPPRPTATIVPVMASVPSVAARVEAKPVVPITSAAARYAVEPPPPIIKPRQQEQAPKPAEKRPDQIFTF